MIARRSFFKKLVAIAVVGDPKKWAKTTVEGKRFALQERIRNRISEGMERNWSDYRVYAVMDKAWAQP